MSLVLSKIISPAFQKTFKKNDIVFRCERVSDISLSKYFQSFFLFYCFISCGTECMSCSCCPKLIKEHHHVDQSSYDNCSVHTSVFLYLFLYLCFFLHIFFSIFMLLFLWINQFICSCWPRAWSQTEPEWEPLHLKQNILLSTTHYSLTRSIIIISNFLHLSCIMDWTLIGAAVLSSLSFETIIPAAQPDTQTSPHRF